MKVAHRTKRQLKKRKKQNKTKTENERSKYRDDVEHFSFYMWPVPFVDRMSLVEDVTINLDVTVRLIN